MGAYPRYGALSRRELRPIQRAYDPPFFAGHQQPPLTNEGHYGNCVFYYAILAVSSSRGDRQLADGDTQWAYPWRDDHTEWACVACWNTEMVSSIPILKVRLALERGVIVHRVRFSATFSWLRLRTIRTNGRTTRKSIRRFSSWTCRTRTSRFRRSSRRRRLLAADSRSREGVLTILATTTIVATIICEYCSGE